MILSAFLKAIRNLDFEKFGIEMKVKIEHFRDSEIGLEISSAWTQNRNSEHPYLEEIYLKEI